MSLAMSFVDPHMSGFERNQEACIEGVLRMVDAALTSHKVLREEIRAGRVRVDGMVRDALPVPPMDQSSAAS